MRGFLYALSILAVVSCSKLEPSGQVEVKDMNLPEFNQVDFKGNFKIFYGNNSENQVSVETYPNIYKNLKIEVKKQTLYISEKKATEGIDTYNINLNVKKGLERIVLADSTDMTISTQMSVPNFDLTLKDNSRFIGSILANKVKIDMSKNSRANLLGRTIDAQMAIRDSASIVAPYWFVQNLKINSENGNYAEISVDKSIDGSIGDTAVLLFYGNPDKTVKVSGKAKLEQKIQP